MKFQKTTLYISLKSYISSVMFLVILYFVEILCQTLYVLNPPETTIIYRRKKMDIYLRR